MEFNQRINRPRQLRQQRTIAQAENGSQNDFQGDLLHAGMNWK